MQIEQITIPMGFRWRFSWLLRLMPLAMAFHFLPVSNRTAHQMTVAWFAMVMSAARLEMRAEGGEWTAVDIDLTVERDGDDDSDGGTLVPVFAGV